MKHYGKHYIDGAWVEPGSAGSRELLDPATEKPYATVATGGTAEDVDKAVASARRAFAGFAKTSVGFRIELIDSIIDTYRKRVDELSDALAMEVGIPKQSRAQVMGPIGHFEVARDLLKTFHFESRIGDTIVRYEPIGVCGLISPWNWPIQTPAIKIIYGIAAGCTMLLKPSDASPVTATLLTEILADAGVPQGVFNLVLGRGRIVGEAISAHPDIDMISFTGSTGAGIKVGETGARTVKRLSLELGGKSANIVLEDADLEAAARWNIQRCFFNTGQSCHAPARMLVHESQVETVIPYLVDEVSKFRIGNPSEKTTTMGPAVNKAQFDTIQHYIQKGIDEGARLICGGLGRPEGLDAGYFVKPTVFVDVTPDMTISREEIFGPVLAVISYSSEEEALEIANASEYGLGGYVFSGDRKRGYEFASGLRAGRVCFNGAATNSLTPMGGYRLSGNGRSMGAIGLEEYLEVKSVYGFEEEAKHLHEMTF